MATTTKETNLVFIVPVYRDAEPMRTVAVCPYHLDARGISQRERQAYAINVGIPCEDCEAEG